MKDYILLNRPFTSTGKIDPNAIGHYLDSLPQHKRAPELILQDAEKNATNPFRKHLDWDDQSAAKKWRLHQIRNIVLCIGIRTADGDIRSFVNLSILNGNENSYFGIDFAAQDQSLIDQALNSIVNEILYFREKHERFKAYFGNLFAAIDETEKAWRNKNEEKQKGDKRRSAKGKTGANRSAAPKARDRDNHARRRNSANGE